MHTHSFLGYNPIPLLLLIYFYFVAFGRSVRLFIAPWLNKFLFYLFLPSSLLFSFPPLLFSLPASLFLYSMHLPYRIQKMLQVYLIFPLHQLRNDRFFNDSLFLLFKNGI